METLREGQQMSSYQTFIPQLTSRNVGIPTHFGVLPFNHQVQATAQFQNQLPQTFHTNLQHYHGVHPLQPTLPLQNDDNTRTSPDMGAPSVTQECAPPAAETQERAQDADNEGDTDKNKDVHEEGDEDEDEDSDDEDDPAIPLPPNEQPGLSHSDRLRAERAARVNGDSPETIGDAKYRSIDGVTGKPRCQELRNELKYRLASDPDATFDGAVYNATAPVAWSWLREHPRVASIVPPELEVTSSGSQENDAMRWNAGKDGIRLINLVVSRKDDYAQIYDGPSRQERDALNTTRAKYVKIYCVHLHHASDNWWTDHRQFFGTVAQEFNDHSSENATRNYAHGYISDDHFKKVGIMFFF